MAHGFGGIRTAQLAGFADRFARAGVAALVFDYRHFGDSDGQPRDLVDIQVQRDDYRAAVAFARADQSVDSRRVAVWGTSFSSGHVLAVAAEDRNIAAAVLTNPYVDGPAALAKARGMTSLPSQLKLLWAWLHDEMNWMFQREPHRVDLTGPPGSVALFTTPDAQPGFVSIMPATTRPLRIPARIIGQGHQRYSPLNGRAMTAATCWWTQPTSWSASSTMSSGSSSETFSAEGLELLLITASSRSLWWARHASRALTRARSSCRSLRTSFVMALPSASCWGPTLSARRR
ncbi:MAG: alpha/beta fold hydrolase [Pseudonocardia sp.]|nr:alpha/beta fold hydrolase [Pseudonocardia sp.]